MANRVLGEDFVDEIFKATMKHIIAPPGLTPPIASASNGSGPSTTISVLPTVVRPDNRSLRTGRPRR